MTLEFICYDDNRLQFTYNTSHSGTCSKSFHMMAQQRDDHAHPKQVLKKKEFRNEPRGIQLLSLSGFYQKPLNRRKHLHVSEFKDSCISLRISSPILFFCSAEISAAALAKLLIEVTQQFIQCSNTTRYTNCLTFSSITVPSYFLSAKNLSSLDSFSHP